MVKDDTEEGVDQSHSSGSIGEELSPSTQPVNQDYIGVVKGCVTTFKEANLPTSVYVFFLLVVCSILYAHLHDTNRHLKMSTSHYYKLLPSNPSPKEYPLKCATKGQNQTCPKYPTNYTPTDNPSVCPDYFRWIHQDLRPWKERGVTREMVDEARKMAHFRLVILGGRMYVEKYRKAIPPRDKFTLWGFLQLLRRYPGRLPDLELLFNCDNGPVIPIKMFRANPLPVFKYCSDNKSLDIVFPDWSFWGWPEINIKTWRNASRDIQEGNTRTKWMDRIPYAYWKGNPRVAVWRKDLMRCNVSPRYDWNARLFVQDWGREQAMGFKQSNVADQCTYRYKIYIEGSGWSVSQKYILGCDSMTLVVERRFQDFVLRGMLPLVHYWPIREHTKCKSIKFAVEWGNNHTDKAQEIGRAASKYMHEDMKMEMVYDFMFHMLNEYAKLLRFKPEIPPGAIELCAEKMACHEEGITRKTMEDSLEKSPHDRAPCKMPPPYDALGLREVLEKTGNFTRQVEMWEDEYWAKFD